MTDHANELRRLAQAATPGPWMLRTAPTSAGLCHIISAADWRGAVIYGDGLRIGVDDSLPKAQELAANASLIAAANPATISELLDRLEAAEKERDFAETEIARLHDDIRELTDVRVLDEEDRDRIVAWRQGTSAQPAPSVPDDIMRDAMRYRFLRAARSIPISTQAARDPVVYDEAIDRAMLAVAPETKP
jgi:hypothetical protein